MTESNHWKTLAIIFMVLFIVETGAVVWLYQIGVEELAKEEDALLKENICSINICRGDEAYFYNVRTSVCDCYVNGAIVHTEVIE